jgi:hypothetical protein
VLSQQVTRQYQRRCVVSRPGSGWNGVGPTRFTHATTSPLLSGHHGIERGQRARALSAPRLHRTIEKLMPMILRTQQVRQALGHRPGSAAHIAARPPAGRKARILRAALPGKSSERDHLVARFPLRCFQRFSLPDVATQPCRSPDNWSTSGPSNPVLSY